MHGIKAPISHSAFHFRAALSLSDGNKMLSVLLQKKRTRVAPCREGQLIMDQQLTEQKAIYTQVRLSGLQSTRLIYNFYFYQRRLIARLGQFGSCPGQQSVHLSSSLWQPSLTCRHAFLVKDYLHTHSCMVDAHTHTLLRPDPPHDVS